MGVFRSFIGAAPLKPAGWGDRSRRAIRRSSAPSSKRPIMNKHERLTPAGAEIVEVLTEFYEALKEGPEAVAKRFTVRTVELDLKPRSYTSEEVKKVRDLLGLSQPLFARFLGVSVKAVRAWENGGKKPSDMACRFLDEIAVKPDYWRMPQAARHHEASGTQRLARRRAGIAVIPCRLRTLPTGPHQQIGRDRRPWQPNEPPVKRPIRCQSPGSANPS